VTQERPRAQKPIPFPNVETQFFWDKVNEEEIWLQRCKTCDQGAYFYPRFFCPKCMSKDVEWFKASGKGKLYTYMINHRPHPAFMAEAPYAIAIVELDEGVRMMTNIHGIENTPEKLILDMPLEVTFEEIAPGRKVPYWKPAGS
jgi:uncharacterized protein